jgi:hypothetical protein
MGQFALFVATIFLVGRIGSCRTNIIGKEAEESSKPNQCRHGGRRNMAAREAGGLKGVALIGGGANSTVAGALHFFQDPSTGNRSLELCGMCGRRKS